MIPMHSHLPFPSMFFLVFCNMYSPFDFHFFFLDSTISFWDRVCSSNKLLEDCDKWGLNSTNEAFASIDSNSFYKPTNSLGYWKENLVLPSTTTTPIIPCLSSCVHQIWSWPFEFDDLFSKLKIQPLKFSSHIGDLNINNDFFCLNFLVANLDSLANENSRYSLLGTWPSFSSLFDHDLFFKTFPILLIFKNLSFKLDFFPLVIPIEYQQCVVFTSPSLCLVLLHVQYQTQLHFLQIASSMVASY
jgi:hypothetical protein